MTATISTEECAHELLDVVPLVMRDIRAQMRSRRTPELTIPQFRTLLFVHRNAGASLSEVANHMGLTLPTMSKLIDDLLKKGMLTRAEHPVDRRRLQLVATSHGVTIMEASKRGTLSYLSGELEKLSAEDRHKIVEAMKTLRSIFKDANKQFDVR